MHPSNVRGSSCRQEHSNSLDESRRFAQLAPAGILHPYQSIGASARRRRAFRRIGAAAPSRQFHPRRSPDLTFFLALVIEPIEACQTKGRAMSGKNRLIRTYLLLSVACPLVAQHEGMHHDMQMPGMKMPGMQ